MLVRLFLLSLLLGGVLPLKVTAQLDSIHWIPPMHARSETGPQYLYITTPEPIAFTVDIRTGDRLLFQTVTIANSQPARVLLDRVTLLCPADSLLSPLRRIGLVLEGKKRFYVNFRLHSDSRNQACDLTSKGRAALGTAFRVGHLFQSTATSGRANFVGVMAAEDDTQVTLSNFDAAVDLQRGASVTVTGAQTVTLKKGESVVFSQYLTGSVTDQPPNGLLGALVSSNKPVAVNVGSWLGAPVSGSNDIGVDQIADVDELGTEYILCKGNGATDMETPLVIAHTNNTKVWVNGSTAPIVTLQAGQYIRLQGTQYSAGGNLYIKASEPVYVYQIVGGVPTGNDIYRTGGLIFVPPISCGIPNAVDNIFQPNQIGTMVFDGGLMVVGMRDSTITVRVDGQTVSLGAPSDVPGYPEFVTYRNLSLFPSSTTPRVAAVVAKGAVQVALFGRNGAAGYGAFYSGFSKTERPNITVRVVGDGLCPDTLVATGRFDGVQWYFADSLLSFGPERTLPVHSPGIYTARGYLGVCRRTDFAEDTAKAAFRAPQFPYTTQNPSCFGYRDGAIRMGLPAGGVPPYQFSVDGGKTFGAEATFPRLARGNYRLVVRDHIGCYNEPLTVTLQEPDSFLVKLQLTSGEEPKPVGETITLAATPNRPIIKTDWRPVRAACATCLELATPLTEKTTFQVIVTDEKGCTAANALTVGVIPPVYVPNVLHLTESARQNHVFTLFSQEDLPMPFLRIYNRWGGLVFEAENIHTNDPTHGWNPFAQSRRIPAGVYVYEAQVEFLPGKRIFLKGDVTVVE